MRLCNSGRTFQLGAIRLTTVLGERVLGERNRSKGGNQKTVSCLIPRKFAHMGLTFRTSAPLAMSAHMEAYIYINLASGNEYANGQ